MRLITRKKQGSTYITILISLIVIEFIVLTMLSSILTSTQASVINKETTIAYRIAESYMEKEIHDIRKELNNNPYFPVNYFCYRNEAIEVSEKQVLLIERNEVNENLCKIEITMTYKTPLLNKNKYQIKSFKIESLVTGR